ncbi:MAG: S46 family peptidase [Bacteroidetes bacterium]|nr:S46 family peptidase [Bacteroidota bacterium]MDA1122256.1 S46 family peptidase [Bacteroidota bacterium]
MNSKLAVFTVLIGITNIVYAQATVDLNDVTLGRFDQGKMWTFENPPVEYFQEEYGFNASQEWMDDIRMSALRFASWCSASFISESGLIMTNHHCSRSVVASVMNEGENFDDNGFYANSLSDERRVPDLFVDQLVKIVDITAEVKALGDIEADSALSVVEANYTKNEAWAGLKLETRTFYSGGKYSLYGFKTYDDIRLVLYPELALGFFGGDPDNFTFPRYNLDFSFYRAYDEEGNPLKPANYFEFNPDGAKEDEAVFIIGNPGSTGRYLTMSQLYYQRDISAPAIITYLKNRMDILLKVAEGMTDVYKKDSVTNMAFSLSNSNKAYAGRLDGLNDSYLMAKKEKKEQQVRSQVRLESVDPWNELEDNVKEASNLYGDLLFLSPNGLKGKVNQMIHLLFTYDQALKNEDESTITETKTKLEALIKGIDINLEGALFAKQLEELKEHSKGGYIENLLDGKAPYDRAKEVMEKSILLTDAEKFFKLKASRTGRESLMQFANVYAPRLQEIRLKYSAINEADEVLQEKVINAQFQLSGVGSPPDATFSLRIADGRVKGYNYNGTTAPYKTTYYGMYDRHYSNDQVFPWNLPERWKNPPMELLKQPLNFVCTADIIGGNSGSPVINKEGQVVGLVFDGNIESLPGFFIFDDTFNRTVSVHAGGIAAAVKYIYKATRLLPELNYE